MRSRDVPCGLGPMSWLNAIKLLRHCSHTEIPRPPYPVNDLLCGLKQRAFIPSQMEYLLSGYLREYSFRVKTFDKMSLVIQPQLFDLPSRNCCPFITRSVPQIQRQSQRACFCRFSTL